MKRTKTKNHEAKSVVCATELPRGFLCGTSNVLRAKPLCSLLILLILFYALVSLVGEALV